MKKFRKPLFPALLALLLLFVSCKQYDTFEDDETSILMSQKDYNKVLNNSVILKNDIKTTLITKSINPINYANIWLKNQGIVKDRDYSLDFNKINYIYTNMYNYNRGENFDIWQYLNDQGIYNNSEMAIINSFINNLGRLSFNDNINNFVNNVNNSNFSNDSKNKLLLLSQTLMLSNDIYPNAFSFNTNTVGQARMSFSCAIALIGLGAAIVGLIATGYGAAAILTAAASANLGAAAIGYVVSLVSVGGACFEQ